MGRLGWGFRFRGLFPFRRLWGYLRAWFGAGEGVRLAWDVVWLKALYLQGDRFD
jgi:hypothetical protein